MIDSRIDLQLSLHKFWMIFSNASRSHLLENDSSCLIIQNGCIHWNKTQIHRNRIHSVFLEYFVWIYCGSNKNTSFPYTQTLGKCHFLPGGGALEIFQVL